MEITKILAQEFNLSEEIIKLVIKDYWKEVKRYCYRPHEIKAGLVLGRIFKLNVRYKQVKRYSFEYERSEYPKYRMLAEYYKEICRVQEKYVMNTPKRQAEVQRLNEYYLKLFSDGNNER
jgi:hypothetical protein